MKSFLTGTIFSAWLLLVILSVLPSAMQAQDNSDDGIIIQTPERGTGVWSGTANLFRQAYFRYNNVGQPEIKKHTQTNLELQFRYLHFIHPSVSIGMEGLGQFYMRNTFGKIMLGGGGFGPLVRYYPFMNSINPQWQPYIQGGGLAGYDLALGDSIGAIRGEGFRVRTSLLGGITYRMSNALGIYVEAGHAWESEGLSSPDARAWQLAFGVQLFRF